MAKKFYVGTSVARVIADSDVPDTLASSVINSLLAGRSLADSLFTDLRNSSIPRFDAFYDFAANGKYHYGLPEAYVDHRRVDIEPLANHLEAQVGDPVDVEYVFTAEANYMHFARRELVENYGYDYTNNEITTLSAQKGYPVYLDDIVPNFRIESIQAYYNQSELNNHGESAQSGYTPERQHLSNTDLQSQVRAYNFTTDETRPRESVIKYVWKDGNDVTHHEEFAFDMEAHDLENVEYLHVHFRWTETPSNATREQYLVYDPNTESEPVLDALIDKSFVQPGDYFPLMFFRRVGTARYAEALHDTDEYKSLVGLADALGLDFQAIGDEIQANPDVKYLEQAVILMGCPANTNDPINAEYLYLFFRDLMEREYSDEQAVLQTFDDPRNVGPTDTFRLFLHCAELEQQLYWHSVRTAIRAGSIGPVGFHTASTVNLNDSGSVQTLILRKQITESAYEELAIEAVTLYYRYFRNYYTNQDPSEDGFLVPIDRKIAAKMDYTKREQLYARSLHFLFNTLQIERVETWKRNVGLILKGAGFLITVVTLGQGASAGLALIATGAGLIALGTYVLIQLAINYLITLVSVEVLRHLDPELALLLAAALAVYQAVKGFKTVDLSTMTAFEAATANLLLQVSNGLVKATQNMVSADVLELSEDYATFQDYRSKQDAKLEEALSTLDSGESLLDPMEVLVDRPLFLPGEATEDYFNRSVHSGNIGAKSFDMLHSYYDEALRLPTFNDTIGDPYYVQ